MPYDRESNTLSYDHKRNLDIGRRSLKQPLHHHLHHPPGRMGPLGRMSAPLTRMTRPAGGMRNFAELHASQAGLQEQRSNPLFGGRESREIEEQPE